jgi:hypothetical protein
MRKLPLGESEDMQQIVIDFDAVNNEDQAKKEQVVRMLTDLGIEYHITERQSLEEYNQEIDEALEDFARGHFITAEELKERSKKW